MSSSSRPAPKRTTIPRTRYRRAPGRTGHRARAPCVYTLADRARLLGAARRLCGVDSVSEVEEVSTVRFRASRALCGKAVNGLRRVPCICRLGTSLIGMTYTHACASDYDDWEKVYENPGWGSKELVPLLRKVGCGISDFARPCIH